MNRSLLLLAILFLDPFVIMHAAASKKPFANSELALLKSQIAQLNASLKEEKERANKLKMQLDTTEEHNATLLTELDKYLLYLFESKQTKEANNLLALCQQLPLQACDQMGRSVLHIAVELGLHNTLSLLFQEEGTPKLNNQDCKGRTPLDIAIRLNNNFAVSLLCKHGANCIENLKKISEITDTDANVATIIALFYGIVDIKLVCNCPICREKIQRKNVYISNDVYIHKDCANVFHKNCILNYMQSSEKCSMKCHTCESDMDLKDYLTMNTMIELLKPKPSNTNGIISKIFS